MSSFRRLVLDDVKSKFSENKLIPQSLSRSSSLILVQFQNNLTSATFRILLFSANTTVFQVNIRYTTYYVLIVLYPNCAGNIRQCCFILQNVAEMSASLFCRKSTVFHGSRYSLFSRFFLFICFQIVPQSRRAFQTKRGFHILSLSH